MCIGGDIYTKTVTVNGRTVYKSRYSTCGCNMPFMNSCWGMGYGYGMYGCCGFFPGNFWSGLGFGAGAGIGMMLPSIVAGIFNKNA